MSTLCILWKLNFDGNIWHFGNYCEYFWQSQTSPPGQPGEGAEWKTIRSSRSCITSTEKWRTRRTEKCRTGRTEKCRTRRTKVYKKGKNTLAYNGHGCAAASEIIQVNFSQLFWKIYFWKKLNWDEEEKESVSSPNGFADYKAHVCPHQEEPQSPNIYTTKHTKFMILMIPTLQSSLRNATNTKKEVYRPLKVRWHIGCWHLEPEWSACL